MSTKINGETWKGHFKDHKTLLPKGWDKPMWLSVPDSHGHLACMVCTHNWLRSDGGAAASTN